MSVIITGSVAYDYLMFFPGRFQEHILPEQLDQISLSFLVESMRKQRGGCAPNIAYSLALLGERPTVMATVGLDFGEYRAWLEGVGVDTSAIMVVEDEFTSSFFVNTDQENNQIASFYMGAMGAADRLSFHDLDHESVELAIISPNAPVAMTKYVRECRALGIPYIYDPSQQIIWLHGDELVEGAEAARLLIVNEYELGMMKNKTGLGEEELLALPDAAIVTRGEEGSTIYAANPSRAEGGEKMHIPAVSPETPGEPTGVGDAYRAGVIKGMLRGYPWYVTGRIAALAATYVLEQFGTQSHTYRLEEFVARYRRIFGDTPHLDDLLRPSAALSAARTAAE
ncbi:MAG: carbohydrate kinase family protein [Anaerolineae bacterium]|jgi:adenosine kinase